jgi:hypothetical protein
VVYDCRRNILGVKGLEENNDGDIVHGLVP